MVVKDVQSTKIEKVIERETKNTGLVNLNKNLFKELTIIIVE
jgi:hypothetical protein